MRRWVGRICKTVGFWKTAQNKQLIFPYYVQSGTLSVDTLSLFIRHSSGSGASVSYIGPTACRPILPFPPENQPFIIWPCRVPFVYRWVQGQNNGRRESSGPDKMRCNIELSALQSTNTNCLDVLPSELRSRPTSICCIAVTIKTSARLVGYDAIWPQFYF